MSMGTGYNESLNETICRHSVLVYVREKRRQREKMEGISSQLLDSREHQNMKKKKKKV